MKESQRAQMFKVIDGAYDGLDLRVVRGETVYPIDSPEFGSYLQILGTEPPVQPVPQPVKHQEPQGKCPTCGWQAKYCSCCGESLGGTSHASSTAAPAPGAADTSASFQRGVDFIQGLRRGKTTTKKGV